MELNGVQLLYLTVFLVVFPLLCYLYCRYRLSFWKRRGIDQLRNPHWFFGNFKDAILFRSPPGWHLGDLYKEAGDKPYIGFYILHKPAILIKNPKLIKQIFVSDFTNFCNRYFAGTQQKDSVGMKNLFGIRNPEWRVLRTKISPSFTKSKSKNILNLLLKTGESMINHINQQHCVNEVKNLNVQELNYTFTTDIISNFALGTKIDSFNNPNTELFKRIAEFFHGFKRMVALVTVFFMPELVNCFGESLLFNSSLFRKLFWTAVEAREKSGNKCGDYIDDLLHLKHSEQNPIFKFEGENLVSQFGMFLAFETSSITASFTLMELARKKSCQDLARKDILQAVNKYGWTYYAFQEMKYLDQCVAETLRMHPIVSTIDRVSNEDYKIRGTNVIIEKGTAVFVSLFGLHQDPKYFENPEIFDPERFAKGNVRPDVYMPFGVGPRKCVATKIGELHVKVIVALILSQYEINQSPDDTVTLDSRFTFTAPVQGITVDFRKLNSHETLGKQS